MYGMSFMVKTWSPKADGSVYFGASLSPMLFLPYALVRTADEDVFSQAQEVRRLYNTLGVLE